MTKYNLGVFFTLQLLIPVAKNLNLKAFKIICHC